jgi:hypothetical protein
MFRRFLFLSVGALALVVALAAPGQVHAQRMMRGGAPNRMMTPFRGGFDSRFNGRMFDPRFNGGRFDRFNGGRFDRFNSGMFDRFNGGMIDPRFNPGFRPGLFRPF